MCFFDTFDTFGFSFFFFGPRLPEINLFLLGFPVECAGTAEFCFNLFKDCSGVQTKRHLGFGVPTVAIPLHVSIHGASLSPDVVPPLPMHLEPCPLCRSTSNVIRKNVASHPIALPSEPLGEMPTFGTSQPALPMGSQDDTQEASHT